MYDLKKKAHYTHRQSGFVLYFVEKIIKDVHLVVMMIVVVVVIMVVVMVVMAGQETTM